MRICVFGSASNTISENYIKAVEELSEILAKRGHNLVFGAGGHGLMGAAARGFSKGGANIIGVIPTFFTEKGVEIVDKNCDEIIYTETMAQRKTKMEELADAFIVVPGGIGTFEELFEVLTLKQLKRHNKPIAILNIDGYYDKLEEFLEVSIEQNFLREECKSLYYYGKDVDEMIKYVESDTTKEFDIKELKNG